MADHFSPFADLPQAAEIQKQQQAPAASHSSQSTNKKRPNENEEEDTPPSTSTSTQQQATKKPRAPNDSTAATATATATATDTTTTITPTTSDSTTTKTVDLTEALEKITKALTSTKVEKSRKALSLFLRLFETETNRENASLFHGSLSFFMYTEGVWARLVSSSNEDKTQATKLGRLIKEQILLFSEEEQYRAATWVLLCTTRNELLTDDTFEFRRAIRQVKEYIHALPPSRTARGQEGGEGGEGEEEGDSYAEKERRQAILACLSTALKQNLFSWAKPSVEDAFRAATERRLLFPEEEREELDEMSTKLRTTARGMAAAAASGVGAVTVNGGTVVSRSVRMANSMSTPWSRKQTDIYR